LVELAGLERENVFIANCVKCRPPGNRNPNTKELQACKPWLEKQIELINPKLIILLGRVATKNLINKEKISEIHGEIIDNKYFVTFHPSAGLRFVKWKLELEKDFTKLKEIIKTL
jgi:DNA polymerase